MLVFSRMTFSFDKNFGPFVRLQALLAAFQQLLRDSPLLRLTVTILLLVNAFLLLFFLGYFLFVSAFVAVGAFIVEGLRFNVSYLRYNFVFIYWIGARRLHDITFKNLNQKRSLAQVRGNLYSAAKNHSNRKLTSKRSMISPKMHLGQEERF